MRQHCFVMSNHLVSNTSLHKLTQKDKTGLEITFAKKLSLFYLTLLSDCQFPFSKFYIPSLKYIKSNRKFNTNFLALLENFNFSLLSRISTTVRIALTANVWSKNWLHHFDNAKRPLSSRTSALCPSAPPPTHCVLK